jgi:hypothetical protein
MSEDPAKEQAPAERFRRQAAAAEINRRRVNEAIEPSVLLVPGHEIAEVDEVVERYPGYLEGCIIAMARKLSQPES